MPKIDLEEQYQLYLKRVALNEAQMHPTQKKQLRQTFYGAAGILLSLFLTDLTKLSDEEGAAVLADMHAQVSAYFVKATLPKN